MRVGRAVIKQADPSTLAGEVMQRSFIKAKKAFTNKQNYRPTDRQTDKQTHRPNNRQTKKQTEINRDTKTEKQTDRLKTDKTTKRGLEWRAHN